jgi:hypothetical protein
MEGSSGNKGIFESLYAFQQMLDLSKKITADSSEEGIETMLDLLRFMTAEFTRVVNEYAEHDLDYKLKAFEARNIIMSNCIHRLIVALSSSSAINELTQVPRCNRASVRGPRRRAGEGPGGVVGGDEPRQPAQPKTVEDTEHRFRERQVAPVR